jgi:hypothetical protein
MLLKAVPEIISAQYLWYRSFTLSFKAFGSWIEPTT